MQWTMRLPISPLGFELFPLGVSELLPKLGIDFRDGAVHQGITDGDADTLEAARGVNDRGHALVVQLGTEGLTLQRSFHATDGTCPVSVASGLALLGDESNSCFGPRQ